MNYSIIRSGSKQYQVMVGKTIKVELTGQAKGPIEFDQVLLSVEGDKVTLGTPTIPGFKVYGTVQGDFKAKKVQVFKYKSKSRYRKLNGHRQQYSLVMIDSIGNAPAKKVEPAKKSTPVTKAAPAKKAVVKKAPAKKAAAKKAAK